MKNLSDTTSRPVRSASGPSSRSRTETIRDYLKTQINAGLIPPGTRLDEARLAERFDVSRTPVRDALRQLGNAGLVEIRPNCGAMVTSLSLHDLIEILEMVGELEGSCAALAARRHSFDDREALIDAHKACAESSQAEDVTSFCESNTRLHEAIYAACHNGHLVEMTLRAAERVSPFRKMTAKRPGRMKNSIPEHQDIVDAICAMDEDRAREAMKNHVNAMRDNVTLIMGT